MTRPAQGNPGQITVFLATLYCALIPFDPIPLISGRTLAWPVGLLLIAASFVEHVAQRRFGRIHAATGVLLGVYSLWIFSSTYWSADPSATLVAGVQILFKICILLSLVSVIPLVWKRLSVAYLSGAVALGVVVLALGEEEYAGRTTVLSADQNWLALSLTLGLSIALYVTIGAGRALMFWAALAAVICISASLATGSRTAVIAMLLVILARVALSGSRKVIRSSLLAIIGLGIGGTIASRLGLIPERVRQLASGAGPLDDSRSTILDLYFSFPEWMLWGVGFQADAQFLQERAGVYLHVHNLLIGTWVQLGIVGVALLCGIVLKATLQARRVDRRELLILMAVPVLSFSWSLGGQTSAIYWLLLAMAVAAPPAFEGRVGERSREHQRSSHTRGYVAQ